LLTTLDGPSFVSELGAPELGSVPTRYAGESALWSGVRRTFIYTIDVHSTRAAWQSLRTGKSMEPDAPARGRQRRWLCTNRRAQARRGRCCASYLITTSYRCATGGGKRCGFLAQIKSLCRDGRLDGDVAVCLWACDETSSEQFYTDSPSASALILAAVQEDPAHLLAIFRYFGVAHRLARVHLFTTCRSRALM
jgi:hypothetical protein